MSENPYQPPASAPQGKGLASPTGLPFILRCAKRGALIAALLSSCVAILAYSLTFQLSRNQLDPSPGWIPRQILFVASGILLYTFIGTVLGAATGMMVSRWRSKGHQARRKVTPP